MGIHGFLVLYTKDLSLGPPFHVTPLRALSCPCRVASGAPGRAAEGLDLGFKAWGLGCKVRGLGLGDWRPRPSIQNLRV